MNEKKKYLNKIWFRIAYELDESTLHIRTFFFFFHLKRIVNLKRVHKENVKSTINSNVKIL